MDELQRNLHNIKILNSNATEYNSIEYLEAARYGETYIRPSNPTAQVRPSKSLYFSEGKSRTWNQSDMRRFKDTGEAHASRLADKRLSISSFRYDDTGYSHQPIEAKRFSPQTDGLTYKNKLPQQYQNTTSSTNHPDDKRMLHRSKSCDRAKETVVKTFKISSDKIQANLSKFSNSIHNKLDEKGKYKLSVNCLSSDEKPTDFYMPAADPDDEDPSAGFSGEGTDCNAPPPGSCQQSCSGSLTRDGKNNKHKYLNPNAAMKPFSCTESQVSFQGLRKQSLTSCLCVF